MSIQRIEPGTRSTPAVIHNGVVYLSGQVGDPEGDIQAQTRDVLAKIETLLEKAGSSKEHLLMATIWLADMSDFAPMNEVWNAWVPEGHAPARACVEAHMARPALLVEICVTAALPDHP